MKHPTEIQAINAALKSMPLADRMAHLASEFKNLALATTFSTEDQLVTWAIVERHSPISISTPLTGSLLENESTLKAITEERYDIQIPVDEDIDPVIAIYPKCQLVRNADRSVPIITWDHKRVSLTINPLADWSFTEVLHAVAEHEIPINPLLDGAHNDHAQTRPHFDARKEQILRRLRPQSLRK